MLTRVRVQGFKAIVDTKPLELGPFMVFLGRNGSGKSSLLEALQWIQESLWDGVQAATVRRFVTFEDMLNRRAKQIAVDLDIATTRYHVEVRRAVDDQARPEVGKETCLVGRSTAKRDEIKTTPRGRRLISGGVRVFDPDTLALAQARGTEAKGAAALLGFLRRAVFLRLSPTTMARPGPLILPVKGPLLDEVGSNLPALLANLTAEQREHVLRGLKEALAGSAQIEEVAVIKNELTQSGTLALAERMRSKGGSKAYKLPAWVLSEGTRRLAAIYTLLALKPRPSLIAIEEIENGLDPWTLGEVLDALQAAAREGVQILLTTHSPYFLDKLDADQIIHVSRQKGDSRYRPITSYKDVMEYEGTVPPGVMYLSNYFQEEGDE